MLKTLKNLIQSKKNFLNIFMDREKNIELYKNSRANKKIKCPNSPLHLLVEVTSKCNLSCKMCNIHYSNRRGEDINGKLLEATYVLANTAKVIQPFGLGEPLLHPGISEIISIYKSRGAFVSIVSNGMLLNPVLSERIIESGLDQLVISIDAADEKLFKEIRRGADLKIIIKNIQLLNEIKKQKKKENPVLGINVVAQASNFTQLPDIIDLSNKLNISFVSLSPVTVHEHIQGLEGEAIYPGLDVRNNILELCRISAREKGILLDDSKLYYTLKALDPEEIYKDKIPCPEPFRFMGIRANGDIFPCCNWDVGKPISKITLNSNIEDELMKIWQCREWNELRKSVINNHYPELCKKCMKNFTRPFMDEYV